MENVAAMQEWQPTSKMFCGIYIFNLLISLDGLRSAEMASAGRGWDMQMVVGAPWVIGLVLGIALWLSARRNQISMAIIGPLLLLLGIMLNFSYEAMDKLTRQMH